MSATTERISLEPCLLQVRFTHTRISFFLKELGFEADDDIGGGGAEWKGWRRWLWLSDEAGVLE